MLIITSKFIGMNAWVLFSTVPILLILWIAFADHQEFKAATRLLAPLCAPSSHELRSAAGRIHPPGLLDKALADFNLVYE